MSSLLLRSALVRLGPVPTRAHSPIPRLTAAPITTPGHSLPGSPFAVSHIRTVRLAIDTNDIKMAVAVANRDLHRLFPVRKRRLARREIMATA